ncbi:MAG: FKBP-type peptidyl-prolyl cis-trans isomerase [Myxococcales bacterium]|nr:FKBP-type peptidyl-prolyl cis-trans isomerase [Myxococcales bacterium]MCB9531727.1 FKBP-type peptidyl-prolyl cis-trans isomerase [Myxococcales bacterium]MCB9534106.1 FKBP-type peptidyl-prolyl cis-trans isomerase [Myxococcales bacterium]
MYSKLTRTLVCALALGACKPSASADSAAAAGEGSAAQAAETAATTGNGSGAAAAPAEATASAAVEAAARAADVDPALAAPADVAAPPVDAERTASGLASKVLQPGTGTTHPGAADRVRVHYTGWTTDGERFDSSVARGEPAEFPLNRVIAGWTEGLQLMVVGEKRRFWIPVELAYNNRPGRPAGMLVFDVELLDIFPTPPPPETPADVAAPPADAERTATGLASKVLQPGTGTEHPAATSVVQVHYTGWTTDGAMFDSSVTRGQPATFPLNGVIPGWTEGVQLMVVGEKRRFWIPVELAYNNAPGAPPGMLVFDVELLNIQNH